MRDDGSSLCRLFTGTILIGLLWRPFSLSPSISSGGSLVAYITAWSPALTPPFKVPCLLYVKMGLLLCQWLSWCILRCHLHTKTVPFLGFNNYKTTDRMIGLLAVLCRLNVAIIVHSWIIWSSLTSVSKRFGPQYFEYLISHSLSALYK